jgi:hypothetical protein
MALCRQLRNPRYCLYVLQSLAELATATEQFERATSLHAASDALRASLRAPIAPYARCEMERSIASARDALGGEAFAAAWEAGRRMRLDEAIAVALAEEWVASSRSGQIS